MKWESAGINNNIGSSPNPAKLNEEIQQADVILLVYDILRRGTVQSLKKMWIPLVTKINKKVDLSCYFRSVTWIRVGSYHYCGK